MSDERGERLARVKLVEKSKDDLEPIRNKALEFLRSQNVMADLQNQLVQFYIRKLNREEDQSAGKRAELQEKLEAMKSDLNSVVEEKKEKLRSLKKIAKATEKQEDLHQEKKDKMGELEQLNIKVFEDRKHAKNKAKDLTKKLEKEKKKLIDLEKMPSANEKELESLSGELEKLADSKKVTEEELTEVTKSLQNETVDLQKKIEEKEQPLMALMKIVNETKQEMDMEVAKLQLYTSNHENAVSALDKVVSRIEEVELELSKTSEERKELKCTVPELGQKLKHETENLKSLKVTENDLSSKLDRARGHLVDAESSAKSAKSQGRVMDFLMELKTSQKLPGIYGRLGNLGAIDEKYDVAISSCCPALENVLVDTIDTAQKCVQALKFNNVGQATFIALDKMERHRRSVQNKPNSALPRLVDLIRVNDEVIRVAFYHALRDTLVGSNLEEATKVAYGRDRRWRVVTLKGEIIDTSGTMTGGGNRIVRGRMGSKCVQQEVIPLDQLRKMQREAGDMETELRSVRSDIALSEEQVENLQRKLDNSRRKLEELSQQASGLKLQLNQLEQQKPGCAAEVEKTKPNLAVQQKMEGVVKKVSKTYENALQKAKKVENEKDKYHQMIVEINSKKLKPVQDSLAHINSNINAAKKKGTKLKVGIQTAERNIDRGKRNLENLQAEIAENDQSMKDLEEQWSGLEETAAQVMQEMDQIQNEKQEMRNQLQEHQMALQEIESKENTAKETIRESQHALDEKIADKEKRNDLLKKWKDRLKHLKLTKIDGEEVGELGILTEEELDQLDEEKIKSLIAMQEDQLNNMEPNMHAVEEYRKKEELYLQRVSELDEITEKRNKHRAVHDELRKRRLSEFSSGFTIITNKLKEMYQMITQGGDAELEFVDSLDPFSEGIVFSVRPPKKTWKNICNLSGGEKTLSSLALVFALHHYRPTPLYVMDEIDAALDFKNVSIIAIYVKERTKNAQFIIISLRNNMFHLADRLIGIYKTDNCTKSAVIVPALVNEKILQLNGPVPPD